MRLNDSRGVLPRYSDDRNSTGQSRLHCGVRSNRCCLPSAPSARFGAKPLAGFAARSLGCVLGRRMPPAVLATRGRQTCFDRRIVRMHGFRRLEGPDPSRDATVHSTRGPEQSNEHTDFWDVFSECAGIEPPHVYSLGSKLEILKRLKSRGVWLCDAIHACNPRFPWNKGKRDRRRNIECFPSLYRTVINASWKYVKGTIIGAQTTWIIGRCVRGNLADPALGKARWFYQPSAGLSNDAKKVQGAQLEWFRGEIAAL